VVGYFTDASSVNHGFLQDGDNFTTIDVPNATDTFPFDISARGEIVGNYYDTSGISHGFSYLKRNFTTIDVPGSMQTFIQGNDLKVFAGSEHQLGTVGGSGDGPRASKWAARIGAEDGKSMVCIETAHAADNLPQLLPGESHKVSALIRAE
jgi:hypothetical protein